MDEEQKKDGDGMSVEKCSVEAAEILANEAQNMPIGEAAPVYERLLLAFPTASKYWKQYVEAHMAVNNDDATKQIFSRCLLNCLHISLWRCYIRFIKKVNEKKGAEGQEETRKAFDFMLNYVGTDIASGPVWMEYIEFLKSLPATTAQEESQRMTSVRKVYQRAIVTPTHHVEQLWRDYENFENSVSRPLAKSLLSEYQPKFNSARAVYRERKKYIDDIDWNVLAVPPTGSPKEEQQYMAWKRLLAFEKGNPQRIDSTTAMRRITFTYEQCLMYLYHYPDIWFDYATWHTKSGSVDSALKVSQRALKALPESGSLKYAFAELEESRGAIQPAKKIYESLLACNSDATALAHIQFIRFLRRTEGVEAARKYFLEVRKSSNCTYHVYVAYAMMEFCLNKDSKVANNVFENGLKKFMHEPRYILEYADFLCRLNDDRNVRALFERALSTLSPEDSVEVWKRFALFEQAYGDLASILKVEQRRKEALSITFDERLSTCDASLKDVVSRYSFMDLWPCTSKELDHLFRQEWVERNANKKAEKTSQQNGADSTEKGSIGHKNLKMSSSSSKVVYPDTSGMVIYDPRQMHGSSILPSINGPELPAAAGAVNSSVTGTSSGSAKTLDEILKIIPSTLATFIAHLPLVEGPSPNVDVVLSVLLQGSIPTGHPSKSVTSQQLQPGFPGQSTSDLSGSSKTRPNTSISSHRLQRGQLGKRKETERQEDDDTVTVQSRPLPQDVFRIRQIQRGQNRRGVTTSQTGSFSAGSAFSEQSGSTG